jgi:hypothetical protein
LKSICLFLFSLLFILSGCSGSRSVLNSGKVVPKGQVRFGKNYTINISSAPISQSVRGAYDLGNTYSKKDTIYYDAQLEHVNAALLSYCLDPIGFNDEIYFRYGVRKRMDIGFKSTGGSKAFDCMYQFLGSVKNVKEVEQEKGNHFYGSIGLLYSYQNYKFLNYQMFDKLQAVFGMEMTRKDIAMPLIFSTSFGPEERVGCFSFGFVYSHAFVKYKITPKNIYAADQINEQYPQLLAPVNAKVNYGSFGTFMNLKVGKKFVFFNFSIAAYYQNYGKYLLLGGNTRTIKGFTIIPSYGMQFNLIKKKKRPVGTEV